MDDNSAYRDLFFEETDSNLEILNEEVLRLEQNPEDTEIIDSIFRSAHTLKGMAATMGYNTMAKLTHSVENVFELFKSKKAKVDTETVSLVFDCLDTLTDIVEALRADESDELDIANLVSRLENVANQKNTEAAYVETTTETKSKEIDLVLSNLEESDFTVINQAEQTDYQAYVITVKVDSDSFMKAARAFLVMNKLEQEGDIIYTEPSADKIEEGDFEDYFKMILLSKLDQSDIKNNILETSEIDEVQIAIFDKTQSLRSDKKVPVEAEVSNETDKVKDKSQDVSKKETPKKSISKQTIRVDLTRLDQFMNLVSELVIHRTRLEDLSEKEKLLELSEPLTEVGRITTELQELVLQLRMQPFNVVLQRFPRMLRDLANELGKEIQLVTEGEDTELDRTVISEIGEPLIHLLRNSADHGIEMPDERERLGKPRLGTVKLAAYPEGNRVVVTLSDDGKGLNPEYIKASAEKKGVSTLGLSDEEIQQLIFHPGFSTAAKVTGISGRGVGMDAVKEKISSLNGTIETVSEVGKGTTFKIILPLTLSIIQALLVRTGGETFALPQAIIDKVNRFDEEEAIQVHQGEVYKYKDTTIPITRLTNALNLDDSNYTSPHIIIVSIGDEKHGLVVDELVQQKEIVIKKLGKELGVMKQFLGATIMGDGSISLILDLTSICKGRKEAKQ
ncbi:chemotaxis protein CheA [Marinilactibacillus psychrotolerans]|uniref:Chemotaxis protein CheA n=1 Tax=Marinilactibacillus psychrotolerans TaxID=191770 RepID=A0A511H1F5_9LACT|nr:chemotaxis protein CheA [Marinilactibacillus psychrotolerans]TLQ09378.1 chemotaxis protein CheA [Marinilactibacillus psychrotolerans]GEL67371.1 chemotaxis protein CheA [Marinilactibacillus psychrotolerans]GEQ36314.1 chemotaxis protein, cheA [Marinilactibacillus psychrotolerans]SDC94975.1 two-component system, chemotaxis family, sensor kinase CheA [Marinilactibacillus psychrotolerans]